MTIELIGVIAVVLGIWGLSRPLSFTVQLFMLATLLGAAAATNLSSVGGISISPAHLLLGFLCIRLVNDQQISANVTEQFRFGRPGFWLLLTIFYSLVTAYFLPRLFAGQTFVFAVRSDTGYRTLLEPAMSNVTQSIYFIGDLVCFTLISSFASTEDGLKTLGRTAIGCAILNLVFAGLDLGTYFTGTTDLLSFIRNANYTLLSDTEVVGFKRIVGSFTEASSFAAATLGYLAFTTQLWLRGYKPPLTLALSMLSLMALIFSTSTTAYVGLVVVLSMLYLIVIFQAFQGQTTRQMTLFLLGAPIAFLMLIILVLLNDSASDYVRNLLDTMVFNKMSTDSGIERSSWNSQAIEAFYATLGFGVGNGSLRASSFLIGVLAGLGVIGSTLFGLFFFTLFFGRNKYNFRAPECDAYRMAAKAACAAWLISASISAALIDLGLAFFAFAAIASSAPAKAYSREMAAAPALSRAGLGESIMLGRDPDTAR